MKKITIVTTLALMLTSSLIANPNLQKNPEGMKKLAQMAGDKSPYYRTKKEVFPKDYFLVSQNIPFLVGTALFNPESDTLKLTKEQLAKLIDMKKRVVPVSAKMAKSVKAMEIELAKNIVDNKKSPESQYQLVDKIAKAKAEMTKAHLKCINSVQNILSDKQFKTLLKLASNSSKVKKNIEKKDNSEAEELFKIKCASCHLTSKPNILSTLVAPPIMGVMRHVKISYPNKDKAIKFMKDYVLNPSQDKAICMPQKIKRFGLMPSQKGLVTEKELNIILPWLYNKFPPKGFHGHGMGQRRCMR